MSAADWALLARLLRAWLPSRHPCASCNAFWYGRCLTTASPRYGEPTGPGDTCAVWMPLELLPWPPRIVELRLLREAHGAERLAGR